MPRDAERVVVVVGESAEHRRSGARGERGDGERLVELLAQVAPGRGLGPDQQARAGRPREGALGEFERAVRFEWARTCLVSGDRSIADVALAAGFSDQAHFSRDFKRRTGTSPRRYRMSTLS